MLARSDQMVPDLAHSKGQRHAGGGRRLRKRAVDRKERLEASNGVRMSEYYLKNSAWRWSVGPKNRLQFVATLRHVWHSTSR